MKILAGIKTIFNSSLTELLQKYLDDKVRRGKITWTDTYNLLMEKTSSIVSDGITLTRQKTGDPIPKTQLERELEIAKLYMSALELESRNIDQVLGTHELLRKDTVRTFTDIQRRYLDIVNHSVQELKTINIQIKNGRIELFPIISQSYTIKDVTTTYAPESYAARTGNDPSPENISSGTDKGYWETTIYTYGKIPVTAQVVLDYKDTITFNKIQINQAARWASTITDVEINENGSWTSIHVEDETNKYLTIIYDQIYSTDKIRITFTQQVGEFNWWTIVDNRRNLLEDDTVEAEIDKSVRESIEKNEYIPFVMEKKENVYGYTIGAYNIITSLNIYSGSVDGTFYSRRFENDDPIESVMLSDEIEEYKPTGSTIEYNIIQQDGSRVSIQPNETAYLTKTFNTTENLTNGHLNIVTLRGSPIRGTEVVYVNGQYGSRVTEFTGSNALEYIIVGKRLFFNKPIQGKRVTINYDHKTDFFIIEIILNNGVLENKYESPYVENFGVVINGIVE